MTKLHSNATTTLNIRKQIHKIRLSKAALARAFKVSVPTITKWKKRRTLEDKSSRPHQKNYSLTDKEKRFIKRLRKNKGLSLDAIWKILLQGNPSITRSVVYRTLVSFGLNKIPENKKQKTKL